MKATEPRRRVDWESMGANENKDVVRRFWNEVIVAGNLDVIDEVVAPNFLNLDMAGDDLGRLKAAITSTLAAVKEQRFDEIEMVAEGDAVFARVNYVVTLPDGSTKAERGLLYYRVVDGRIVANDMMSAPI